MTSRSDDHGEWSDTDLGGEAPCWAHFIDDLDRSTPVDDEVSSEGGHQPEHTDATGRPPRSNHADRRG